MRIRMYNVGFGDCFCLRERDRSLLVDFGSSNSRIGSRPRRDVFDRIISDLAGMEQKNLLLTHFHLDHLSGLLYMMKNRSSSREFGKIYLPDVFSRPEYSRTLTLLLLADLMKNSMLPSRQVSLFALVEALCASPQNVELVSRGKLFQDKYMALWPDMDIICAETEAMMRSIGENYTAILETITGMAERMRRAVYGMTAEGRQPDNTASNVNELERDFRLMRNRVDFQQLLLHMEAEKIELRSFKNKISIVFQNAYESHENILFTGDAEQRHLRKIAENYDGEISLYDHYWCIKVPHHGTEAHYFDFSGYTPENMLISNGIYYANNKKRAKAYYTSARYAGLFRIGSGNTYMYCSNSSCCDCYNGGCACSEPHVIAPGYYMDI